MSELTVWLAFGLMLALLFALGVAINGLIKTAPPPEEWQAAAKEAWETIKKSLKDGKDE